MEGERPVPFIMCDIKGRHNLIVHAIWQDKFKGENFCEFCGFVAICKSFLPEVWWRGVSWHNKSEQSAKAFSHYTVHENPPM